MVLFESIYRFANCAKETLVRTGQKDFFSKRGFSNSHKDTKAMSGVLKYTRPDLATLTYHPVRPLDVISREVSHCELFA
jgi:hypothetical protein